MRAIKRARTEEFNTIANNVTLAILFKELPPPTGTPSSRGRVHSPRRPSSRGRISKIASQTPPLERTLRVSNVCDDGNFSFPKEYSTASAVEDGGVQTFRDALSYFRSRYSENSLRGLRLSSLFKRDSFIRVVPLQEGEFFSISIFSFIVVPMEGINPP